MRSLENLIYSSKVLILTSYDWIRDYLFTLILLKLDNFYFKFKNYSKLQSDLFFNFKLN